MPVVNLRRNATGQLPHDIAPGDRILREVNDGEDERSSVVAFLLGGVMIAGGMLAVLYLDSATATPDRDTLTTGSIKPIERTVPARP